MLVFEPKQPTVVDRFVTSDNKIHDCHEVARCHEVYLALKPSLFKGHGTETYQNITMLARQFDFVPRETSKGA